MTNEIIQPEKAQLSCLVIIDDEEDILRALRSLFRREKYRMYFFSSGIHALEFLEHNNADVIISDMRMPEISGIELLERSAAVNPTAICIILSGYEEKQVVLNAVQRGLAQHYIIKPWDDEQLRNSVKEAMELQEQLRKKQLQGVMHTFRNLPSPPKLHAKLVKILESDTQLQKEIATEIEKSPALVAKLLRISNSVFYGARKQISSVYEALTFIGTESVLGIVLGLESFDTLNNEADPQVLRLIEEIREMSIIRAHVAREISIQWSEKKEQHEVYVAALLLDIGLVLRFCSSPEKFNEFYTAYKKNEQHVYSIDKQLYSITHDDVGAALLSYWNFPPRIVAAVANHHRYTGDDALTTIVQLADALVQKKDSFPHDPRIDGYLLEWEPKLNSAINKIQESNNHFG